MDHYVAYEGAVAIALGAMTPDYLPLLTAGVNDERSGIEGTRQRAPYALESGTEWLASMTKSRGKDEVFAILLREGESYRYIGHTGIHGITWPDGYGTTGSMMFGNDLQGKGYGTEAKLLLLYHCFNVLGLRKVCSSVKAFNVKSFGHLLKCGYTTIGRRRQHDFHRGAYVDEFLFEIFRDEWLPVWERYRKENVLPKLTSLQREFVKESTT